MSVHEGTDSGVRNPLVAGISDGRELHLKGLLMHGGVLVAVVAYEGHGMRDHGACKGICGSETRSLASSRVCAASNKT